MMKGLSFVSLTLLAALLIGPSPGTAQSPRRTIKHQVTCSACRVEFTKVATLGNPSDPALISRFSNIERDSRGRYFAFSDYSEIIVYDSTGAFLRTFGRAGNGPGEFAAGLPVGPTGTSIPSIRAIRVGGGDSIIAFHSGRASVFSPEFAHARTVAISPVVRSGSRYVLQDGSWILGGELVRGRSGGARTENLILHRIHVVSPLGVAGRALGAPDTIAPGESLAGPGGSFNVTPDGRSIWQSDPGARYIFNHWRISDNAHIGEFEIRDAPWFTERTYVTEAGRAGSYQRSVGGSFVSITGIDTSGYLWFLGRVVDPAAPQPTVGSTITYSTYHLEIFDPRTGTLRSSQKADRIFALLSTGNFAYSPAENADGIPSFTVYRFRHVER